MARNSREPKERERVSIAERVDLKKETLETVVAIVLILISVFLLLAPLGKAGFVGEKVYEWLSYLFGIGYFLLPFVMIALGVTFLRSLKHSLTPTRIAGSVLFLLAGLGFVHLISARAGVFGGLIERPLVSLFDSIVAGLFLSGATVIGLLIVLDTPLSFTWFIEKFNAWRAARAAANETEDDSFTITGDTEDIDPRVLAKAEARAAREVARAAADDEEGSEEGDEESAAPAMQTERKKVEKIDTDEAAVIKFSPLSATPYDPPPLSILERDSGKPAAGDVKANANIIKRTLQNFGINVEMDEVSIGPTVTRYALKPAEGVKLSRIVSLHSDLALALAAHPLRIEAPIPGKSLVGIEIPNSKKTTVGLGTLFSSPEFENSDKPLTIALGKGITGAMQFSNLAKAPHLLVAGTTGSGKSVTIHTMVVSLLYRNSPDSLKFIMIDPKRVELTLYNKIPHLLTPVINDAKKAILSLRWAAKEMERRYDILQGVGCRDVQSYHKTIVSPALEKAKKDGDTENMPDAMPYIVIIIDELADIMQTYPKELEAAIVRLAQMSRAVGIHLVLSTQRPSVNVITGLIKANVPSRIALQVASQIDSRTILDQPGAEKLLGAGDMLLLASDMSSPIRVQSAYITEGEVKKVVEHLSKAYGDSLPNELDLTGASENRNSNMFDSLGGGSLEGDADDDELFDEAKQTVIQAGKASTSFLQRKLRIGYARAARLIDILEERGVIGPGDGARPREVLGGGGSLRDEDGRNDLNSL